MSYKNVLRAKAKSMEPTIRVGKLGLSTPMIAELNKLLENKQLIKVKLLGASFEGKNKKEFIEKIVESTNSELIEAVGNVVVLYRS